MAEQSLSKLAQTCKVGESMKDFKRFLTNTQEPWLLILDNADDPSLDISQFFPTGNRGTIIVTSRNPECRCHATVGSRKLGEMDSDEAITLLLRSGDLFCDNEHLRGLALPIVKTLGYLALAVNHAGASIRQKTCSLESYLKIYTHHRKRLLDRGPVQASSDYRYTVYTTWEVSVDSIKKLARDATNSTATKSLDLLTFLGFCHFDNITESIFQSAWENFGRTKEFPWWRSNLLGMIQDRRLPDWDSLEFNETIQLLLRYSLIHFSGQDNRVSLHPLVHSWIRDSLNEEMHLKWWNITLSTLALAREDESYRFERQLRTHLRHCLNARQTDDLFLDDEAPLDKMEICSIIVDLYHWYPYVDAQLISRLALEYSRRVLGDECYFTCRLSYQVARCFNSSSEYQKALDLLQDLVDVSVRIVGPTDDLTLKIMRELSYAYRKLGRMQEALEIAPKLLAIRENSPSNRDEEYRFALLEVFQLYLDLDRCQEAVNLLEQQLSRSKEIYTEETMQVAVLEWYLAIAYSSSGQHEASLRLYQNASKAYSKTVGEDHPVTVHSTAMTALEYGHIGLPEKGIPLLVKALETSSKAGADENRDYLEANLRWLESESKRLQSQSAKTSTTISRMPAKPRKLPLFDDEEISSGERWGLTWRPRR